MGMQINNESPFSFEELFFSKTDTRGVIQSGNSVFQRVSEFEWNELLNKPHNAIRHPDMPKGVFFLLWEYLKANKPLGAFVKNRSKSGKYYWVYALAMPVENGYLSVRLKPSGDLLETIKVEYEALKKIERERKIQPEESRTLLLARLKELGFPTYESFIAHAIVDQFNRRREALSEEMSIELTLAADLKTNCDRIIEHTKQILKSYQTTKFVPLNLEVEAARLGDHGRELAIVAHRYQQMADEVKVAISEFGTLSGMVESCVQEGQFLIIASKLLDSISKFIETDRLQSINEIDSSAAEIKNLSTACRNLSAEGIRKVKSAIDQFISTCSSLQTMGSGLELVRLAGKIESARCQDAKDVEALLGELKTFQLSLAQELGEVMQANASMKASSGELLTLINKRTA